MDALTILRRFAPFKTLPLDQLAVISRVQKLARDELVWDAGTIPASFVIVGAGVVIVAGSHRGGASAVYDIHGPGELVDAHASLSGRQHAFAAKAITSVGATVVRVPRSAVLAALRENAQASLAMAELIGASIENARWRLSLSYASVDQRITSILADLHARFGDTLDDGRALIPLDLTRVNVAEMAGTTYESVIRSFGRLVNAGVIENPDLQPGFVIKNLAKLVEMSAEPDRRIETDAPLDNVIPIRPSRESARCEDDDETPPETVDDTQCEAWCVKNGQCALPRGHYRSNCEPDPSPHRSKTGGRWFGAGDHRVP